MALEVGQEIDVSQVPNYAVFSAVRSATHGILYQLVDGEFWHIGHTRMPEQRVRSDLPFKNFSSDKPLHDPFTPVEVKVRVEMLLDNPLLHVPRAEKLHDFSFFGR